MALPMPPPPPAPPPKVVPAESSILLAGWIDVVYLRWTLRNIVLRNILGLAVHPYCFSLRWRGIRLFYYTIFVANLEKFSSFFLLPSSFIPLSRLRSAFSGFFCDFDSISYIITLLILGSSEVRRSRSYDFHPVNNVDFSMISSR